MYAFTNNQIYNENDTRTGWLTKRQTVSTALAGKYASFYNEDEVKKTKTSNPKESGDRPSESHRLLNLVSEVKLRQKTEPGSDRV